MYKEILKSVLDGFGWNIRPLRNCPRGTSRFLYKGVEERHARERADSPFVIFDVGANRGQTMINFARAFPEAEIRSFEPSPDSFAVLSKQALRYSNVSVEQLALGDQPGKAKLHLHDAANPASEMNSLAANSSNGTAGGATVDVEVSTLDLYCDSQGISHIDILKSDTEGFELKVLEGAQKLLQGNRISSVLVECCLMERVNRYTHIELARLDAYLHPFGFEFFGLYDPIYRADNSFFCANALFVRG